MIDNYKVGNRIALLRKEKGLTGEKFAELLGVSPQAVSKWENGKCLPESSLLPNVAALLGTTIDSILIPQELVILNDDTESHRYKVLAGKISLIPDTYELDPEKKTLKIEDLGKNIDYVCGNNYDEDNSLGSFIRQNYSGIIQAAAEWHSSFWENGDVFSLIGLDWRFQTKENLLSHISMMEKDFIKYRKAEESGDVPKVWEDKFNGIPFRFENHITAGQLDYFEDALKRLKSCYWESVSSRVHSGKNITVIHGDMNPSVVYVPKVSGKQVKFNHLQAVRMGLPTEDLAMLLALHIAPEKASAMPMLDEYHTSLCKNVSDYSYELFMSDYKIAIMENMFFTVKLINRGIFDFKMRDKALIAFKSFVL